jgi:hypothetical protein
MVFASGTDTVPIKEIPLGADLLCLKLGTVACDLYHFGAEWVGRQDGGKKQCERCGESHELWGMANPSVMGVTGG